MKVLLAEDDDLTRQGLAEVLEEEGYGGGPLSGCGWIAASEQHNPREDVDPSPPVVRRAEEGVAC